MLPMPLISHFIIFFFSLGRIRETLNFPENPLDISWEAAINIYIYISVYIYIDIDISWCCCPTSASCELVTRSGVAL